VVPVVPVVPVVEVVAPDVEVVPVALTAPLEAPVASHRPDLQVSEPQQSELEPQVSPAPTQVFPVEVEPPPEQAARVTVRPKTKRREGKASSR
jgi:hypothetical protein